MFYYRMYPTRETESGEVQVVLINHLRKKEEVICASLQNNGQLRDQSGREAKVVKVLPQNYTYSGFFNEQYPLVAEEKDPQCLYDLPSRMESVEASTIYANHRTVAIDQWTKPNVK